MPAKSKKQRKFMGMVHAVQKGEIKAPSAKVAKAAKSMSKKSSKDFAKTPEKGLPTKVKKTKKSNKFNGGAYEKARKNHYGLK